MFQDEGGETYVVSTNELKNSGVDPSCGLSKADTEKVLNFIKPKGIFVQGILKVLALNGWDDEVKDIRKARKKALQKGLKGTSRDGSDEDLS